MNFQMIPEMEEKRKPNNFFYIPSISVQRDSRISCSSFPIPRISRITIFPDEIVNTQTACGADSDERYGTAYRNGVLLFSVPRGNWKSFEINAQVTGLSCFVVLASNGISSRFQLIPMHRDSRSHSR